jgi:hypothetical protein
MATFHEFLLSRLAIGGCSTEDTLASVLPLMHQVFETHATGNVAPLEGVAALQVENAQIWYRVADAKSPRKNPDRIRLLDSPPREVDVVGDNKREIDVNDGSSRWRNEWIGSRDQEIVRPVYLPGYVCWEQLAEHHDPLSDIFALGMILASLAFSLDFNEFEDLETFVANRDNLFRVQPEFNAVVVKAIVAMTELKRARRPQDLGILIRYLENYRAQSVDFSIPSDAAAMTAGTKRQVVLSKLQERLFEISRRNRLLHFRPSMQTLDLTHASVPLSFAVENIRPGQILTWKDKFAETMAAGEPVSLTGYLNFQEQIFLPSVLDRIRTEAARDAAEFGFQQLKLAICFLRWTNLKESPAEQYDSPLVLLPVRLVKKKGVRDSFVLQPLTTEAEINPVVRHLFKLLYDISLPSSIDLAETSLDNLFDDLTRRIALSEPGIRLNKIERPRIELMLDLAKRRVAKFRKSTRLSGRGIRSFLNLDYSYDPSNFHPLGVAIFNALVRPPATHLREIVQAAPAPRHFALAPDTATISEKSKLFYSLKENGSDNPYHWEFDLCRITLGNFKYRKMALMKDYSELLDNATASSVFDSVFSLSPRPAEQPAKNPGLEERYHVVSCDPTQAAAIAFSRTGANHIIQGPPGTGKSQTITNLIADHVMRGKRVLFVCAKRAALDVVYARLKQRDLHTLCCLIHDSQADKREFILDLKATYEGLLEPKSARAGPGDEMDRLGILNSLQRELRPLQEFREAMVSTPAIAGDLILRVFERAIELSEALPALSPAEKERLPEYSLWVENREAIRQFTAAVAKFAPDGVFANHPLHHIRPGLAQEARPILLAESSMKAAQEQIGLLSAAMLDAGLTAAQWDSLRILRSAQECQPADFLVQVGLIDLVSTESPLSARLAAALQEHATAQEKLEKARRANVNWTNKLSAEEVTIALEQARAFESSSFAFLKPAWWRLRSALQRHYRFANHAIKPAWSQVLSSLQKEYQADAAAEQIEQRLRADFHMPGQVGDFERLTGYARRWFAEIQRLLGSDTGKRPPAFAGKLVVAASMSERLMKTCGTFLEDFEQLPIEELRAALAGAREALPDLPDFLYPLGRMACLPPTIRKAFRSLAIDGRTMEAAIASCCVDHVLRTEPALHTFNGMARDAQASRLAELGREWQHANARGVLDQVARRFLERVAFATQSMAGRTAREKEIKAEYNRGRRELEHEFGKVTRHKSVRDLAAGDSGVVVQDLKPVWLMSPLSVSDTLPLSCDLFDVVIFDEASQVPLEEAIPAIFRAKQAIIVGDEMQLPPTEFFSAKGGDENDETGEGRLRMREDGEIVEYDLSANSLLSHAAKNLPSRMLKWHYRSRFESLINFSNWAFYGGELLTVPERRFQTETSSEIVVGASEEAVIHARCLEDRPVSFHFLPNGVYDNRRNRAEAEYIAQLTQAILAGPGAPSIGIVAFSEAQQTEIEDALSRLALRDKEFAMRLEAEWEREIDGQFIGLLVKNLENIQGDERDVVILSVCYGHAPDGKMRMNFGPINQNGGEKRLNVAFSRAKHNMIVVSSVRDTDITNDYNEGANCLKRYLRYAAACSTGDHRSSQRMAQGAASLDAIRLRAEGPVAGQVAAALESRGYLVGRGVGMSHFRCDVAVAVPGELRYRLGILVDSERHYLNEDTLESEVMRPQLLKDFGWPIEHVLARDWYTDRSGVLMRLQKSIEERA